MGNKQFSEADIQSQAGKTVLVTGASSGLGFSSAKIMAAKGAKVFIVGRDEKKCQQSIAEIKQHASHADVEYLLADFGDLNQVKQLAADIQTRIPKLDVLLMNAGVAMTAYKLTTSGIEQTFHVNHLSHFFLFKELEKYIVTNKTRIVTVSSGMVNLIPSLNKYNYNHDIPKSLVAINDAKKYNPENAYALSKLCNVLFVKSVVEKHGAAGVIASTIDPGAVRTDITRGDGKGWFPFAIAFVVRYLGVNPDVGALTQVYASTADNLPNGSSWQPTAKPWNIAPGIVKDEDAGKLWRLSEQILREKGF